MDTQFSDIAFELTVSILFIITFIVIIHFIYIWFKKLTRICIYYFNIAYSEVKLYIRKMFPIFFFINLIGFVLNGLLGISDSNQFAYWILFAIITAFFAIFAYDRKEAIRLYRQNSELKYNKPISYKDNEGRMTVELDRQADGHFYVNALVNGISVNFLVDTGASYISLPAWIAKLANMQKQEQISIHTANGIITGWRTNCKELIIGNIRFNDTDASISERDNIPLLGMSALSKVDVYLKGNKMLLKVKKNRQKRKS